ncbi:transposase [Echinicola vietnamensis]|uniref:Transposase n=1 Tax=Echinicola vietnamensis (strain DSM 17526 / LMG 23754 / KMM 6221) TaxID=926556 RepID=L0FY54_ECHVK|nr:transposase [Echinicola vietnamensis]AGA78849.1 transposase [Echinicola vietnamensis DSM 17526]
MAQSLSKLYIHLVYHVKTTSVKIRKEDKKALYAYIGSIIKENDSIPIKINGMEDHVHILCVMSKNISLSKFTENIKRHSSRWIKTINPIYKDFAWQGGYAGFSVSPSIYEKTKKYIEDQEAHHKKFSFKEEYRRFLKEYEIDFNEAYILLD